MQQPLLFFWLRCLSVGRPKDDEDILIGIAHVACTALAAGREDAILDKAGEAVTFVSAQQLRSASVADRKFPDAILFAKTQISVPGKKAGTTTLLGDRMTWECKRR